MRKILNFYFILILLFLFFLEILSFLFIEVKKKNIANYISKLSSLHPNVINNYSEYIPHTRDKSTFVRLEHIKFNNNNQFFNIINEFNNKTKLNILIQGDSWAEKLNNKKTFFQLKEFSQNNNLGMINAGIASFSVSPMKTQLHILSKEFSIKPNIIIALIDQTDIGDELFRYKNLNKSNFSTSLNYSNKIFNINALKNFETFNLSIFKIIQYSTNYFLLQKKNYNLNNKETFKLIYKKIKSKITKKPLVLYPLIDGISKTQKIKIKERINNYINFAFQNKDLKNLLFVTHPHLKHNNIYKANISQIVNQVIDESKHKKYIKHLDFNKINYKTRESIYIKDDPFSHLTPAAYSNYYLPEILKRIDF